jgi:filamentous hemagglutinin family protein
VLRPVALAAASALGLLGQPLQAAGPAPNALPSGLNVVHGQAEVATVLKGTAAQMTVRNSAGAILDWRSFDIGAQAGVHFQQADAASKVLNRVTGSDPSHILGSLTSNGQVWLLNPQGVLFGAGARVDVAGLVASTLRLDSNAFLDGLRSGRFSFAEGAAGATVRNEGAIRTAHGGHLVLLGEHVHNTGTLDAPGGALLLGGVRSATLVDSALPHLAALVPAGEVLNLGRAAADGGVVDVYASVVNQQGLVRADTLGVDAQGRIVLKAADTLMLAAGSATQAAGSAAGHTGGAIDLLGTQVGLVGDARVDASGPAGGGAVRVGGGLMGQDRSVANARAVYIGPEARLHADATGAAGAGGSVIVWSDAATRAYGHFSARGGTVSGDGGFIETSGGWLDARPAGIDLASLGGRAGQWLIDPNNLTIRDTGPDTAITGGPSFTTTGDSAVITTATIAAALNAGSSVTLTTAAVGGNQPGDIFMSNATLAVAPATPVTLTLNATRDIVVQDSSITSTGAALSLDFRAAGNGAFGVISIANSSITTAGGSVTLGGAALRQLPLPGGSVTGDTFRPARAYSSNTGGVSSALGQGLDAVRVDGSVFQLGAGTFRAVGEGALDARDGVVLSSDGGPMRLSAARVELIGHSPAPDGVDLDRIGVIVGGQDTEVVASTAILIQAAGDAGAEVGSGARLALAAGGAGSLRIDGVGGARPGVSLYSWDVDTDTPGRGTRIAVAGGTLDINARSVFGNEALVLDNTLGAAGPLLDLTAATGATLAAVGADGALRAVGVDIVPPAAGTLTLSAASLISLSEVFVSATGGALSLSAAGIAIDNSVISSTAGALALDFATVGATPAGVDILNTIIETRGGDVRFGDLRTVSSPILGSSGAPARWLESNSSDTPAALSIRDSVIDAGSGSITGGGAVGAAGFDVPGVLLFRSVFDATRIELAGRSDFAEGLASDESTLRATRVLALTGDSASNFPPTAQGLRIGLRSTLQLLDTTNDAGSRLALTGRKLGDGIGLLVEGGAVGSGNETRISIEGADAVLTGVAGSGSGLVLRGSADASGGALVSAPLARLLRLDGSVTLDAATGGTGTGVQLFHARLIGPQISDTAPLEITANGGGADGAGLKLQFSSISSGGVTTLAGNSILVSNSLLSGDGSIDLFAVDRGASAGSVVIEQSFLQTSRPTARVFAGTRTGGAAIGVADIAGGAGVQVSDSVVESSDGGGVVELRGDGAASGGRGVVFARSSLIATSLTLVGRGGFDGDGVFSDQLGTERSTLRTRNLLVDGLAANDPAATQLTRAGVVLGRGVELVLADGGTVQIGGDLVALGRSGSMGAEAALPFSATGGPASFGITATRSMLLREATLDFSAGAGTAVLLRGDTDALEGGRVRLAGGTVIRTGGGSFTAEGQGSLAAVPAAGLPGATVVLEGGIGVYLSGASVDAGAGPVTLTGRTVDDGGLGGNEPTLGGVVLGGTALANTVTGGRVLLDGTALGAGFGVIVGEVGSTVPHRVNADELLITGTGQGRISATGQLAPGVRVLPLGQLRPGSSASIEGRAGTGIEFLSASVIGTGDVSIVGAGPVSSQGTELSAAGSLLVQGVGTPPPVVVGEVEEAGVFIGEATLTQGASVTLRSSKPSGGVGLRLEAANGSPRIQANAGRVLLSGSVVPAGGQVAVLGNWDIRATSGIEFESALRLELAPSPVNGLAPVLGAPEVVVTLAAVGPVAMASGGSDLDLSVFSGAVAGLDAASRVELRVTGAGPVGIDGTLAVPGRLRLQAAGVTLAADSQISAAASGDAIVIGGVGGGATGSFVNDAGGSALFTPNGRWVLLGSGPASTTLGGLVPDFSAYGLDSTPWLLDGDGNLLTPLPGNALGYGLGTADVAGSALVVSQTRAYDGTAAITLDPAGWAVSGLVPGDVLNLAGPTAASMADKTVGVDKPVTPDPAAVFSVVDAGGRPVFGYELPALRATITPLALSATGVAVASKVYDGTTAASLASLGSVTPLAGDLVAVGGTVLASFADRNVGVAKPVLATGFELTGPDAGNYTLVPPTGLVADITPRALPVTGLVALSKVYDTTTGATLSGTAAVSPLAGDTVALAGAAVASFADRNVGVAKPVAVAGLLLTGADAGNYTLQAPAGLAADITPAVLAVSGLSAANKVYDATTAATLAGVATLAPALGTDTVVLAGVASGSFADRNVGAAKPVLLGGLTLTGADAGNYTLAAPGLVASITPAPLPVAGLVAVSKVYDGGTAATLSGTPTVAPLGTDLVTLAGVATGSFADRNVGLIKPVAVAGLSLAGADAGNYSLVLPGTLVADITPRALPVSGLAAVSRVYDGGTVAALTGTATVAPLGGDAVALAGAAVGRFADKNVGLAKPVAVAGLLLTGADAGNYTLQAPAGLNADISPAALPVTGLSAQSRPYDRSTVAPLAGAAAIAPLAGDSVTLGGVAVGRFDSAAAGVAKPVAVDGLVLAGADAGNYTLVPPSGLSADVTPLLLSLAGPAAASRVYDAGTTAAVSGSLVGVLAGDAVGVSLSGSFADADVGLAKPVVVAGTLTGADAGNYSLSLPLGLVADITPATLRYVAVPAFGTAGQSLPVLTGNVSGLLGADTLASATTGTAVWASPATASSPAGAYAITGSGLSAANYRFEQDAANATALTLRAAAVSDPVSTATTVVTTTALLAVNVPVLMSTPTEGRTLDVTPAFAGSLGAEAERRASLGAAAPGLPVPGAGAGAAVGGGAGALPTSPPAGVPGVPADAPVPPGAPAGGPPASLPGLVPTLGSLAGEAAGGLSFAALDFSRLPRDEVQTLLAARARYKQQVFADGIHRLQQDPTLADVRACRNEAELDSGQCLITEELKRQIQAARAEIAAVDAARRAAEAAQITQANADVASARPGRAGQRRVVQATLPVIERKLALVIGVNHYRDKAVPQLEGAVRDARAIRDRLEQRLGYETTVLESPTREQIVRAFNRLALEAQATDSVIVYYAGHGVLVPVDGVETGFWLPSDVDSRNEKTWLSNADIARLLATIGSQQLMLVSDSCYSGTLVGRERVAVGGASADELLKRRAAVVMSSGGDEPVADEGKDGHSFFAWHFMRALEGLDGWQPGSNLYERLRGAVSREFPQTPQYGASRGLGHQGDTDYLFERRELEAAAKAP